MSDPGADVTAFEAKTRLSELLRETERGRSFVIRRRGKPVARLVPYVRDEQTADLGPILKAFREEYKVRQAVVVSLDPKPRILDGILIIPWEEFLGRLWDGRILK